MIDYDIKIDFDKNKLLQPNRVACGAKHTLVVSDSGELFVFGQVLELICIIGH